MALFLLTLQGLGMATMDGANQLNLLADANEGRLLGWSLIQQPQ